MDSWLFGKDIFCIRVVPIDAIRVVPLMPFVLYPLMPFVLYPLMPFVLYPLMPFVLYPLMPFVLYPLMPFVLYPLMPFALYPLMPFFIIASQGIKNVLTALKVFNTIRKVSPECTCEAQNNSSLPDNQPYFTAVFHATVSRETSASTTCI